MLVNGLEGVLEPCGPEAPGTAVQTIRKRPSRRIVLTEEDAARIAELMRGGGPVEVELGCGKALYVVTRAERDRHLQFLGIDTSLRYLRRARRRSLNRNLTNLILVKADVREVVQRCIPPGRIAAFHVLFPDPWPKRRHWKRRLLSPAFLSSLRERLAGGGKLIVATDAEEYFRAVELAAREMPQGWRETRTGMNQRPNGDFARSGFENKCLATGMPVYYLELTA